MICWNLEQTSHELLSFQQFSERLLNGNDKILGGTLTSQKLSWGFPSGSVLKNLPAKAGNMGWIPDPGRSLMQQSN